MGLELLIGLGILWPLAFLFLGRIQELPAAEPCAEGVRDGAGEGVQASPAPDPADDTGDRSRPGVAPSISVIIPARNEEANLPHLLTSLGVQVVPPAEIIVVDDFSDDATAAVARRYGARVEHPAPEAADWLGKPRACWTGAQCARSDLLVFVDADTTLAPGGLACLVAAHGRYGGLISVQPYHAMRRAYEKLSAFFNIVLMAALRSFTVLGHRIRPHGSFGPCLVCSAEDYHRTDGHALVKHEVLEDVALGRAMSDRGVRLTNFAGRGAVRFRMYPGGLRDVTDGWTKNFARGAMTTAPFLLFMISVWIIGSAAAVRFAAMAPVLGLTPAAIIGVAFYGAYVLQLWWLLRRIGNFGIATALLYPLPLLFFVWVFLRSLYFTLVRKSVTWKGRTIRVDGGRERRRPR